MGDYEHQYGGEGAEMSPAAVVTENAAVTDDHFLTRQVAYQNAMRSPSSPRMTLGVPTRAALKIRRGDLVFENTTVRTIDGNGITGASRVSVFAGFRGIDFKLVAQPGTGRRYTASGNATIKDQNGVLLNARATTEVIKYSVDAHIANYVKFVGVALSNYIPGDMRQSNSGVAVAVGGKVSVVNTTGAKVRRGDLLYIRYPTSQAGDYAGADNRPLWPDRDADDPETTRSDALQPLLGNYKQGLREATTAGSGDEFKRDHAPVMRAVSAAPSDALVEVIILA